MKKGLESTPPVLQIGQNITENYCPSLYLSTGQVRWLVVQNIYSKLHLILFTNTHHYFTDLVKIPELEYLENGTWFFYEIKKI